MSINLAIFSFPIKNNIVTLSHKSTAAAVAQLVEHQLPKLRVASSSLVCRSTDKVLKISELTFILNVLFVSISEI